MNEMYIVSFNSTHHAIRLDKLLGEASVRATTLPTPREITASCGISIRFLYEDIEKVKNTLVENNIEYKGIYKITRLENGTKEVEDKHPVEVKTSKFKEFYDNSKGKLKQAFDKLKEIFGKDKQVDISKENDDEIKQ